MAPEAAGSSIKVMLGHYLFSYTKMVISMIIDIRENYEYKMGHIDNSINVPMDLILLVPEKYLKKNKVYYLLCDKGIYSNEVSAKLNKMGYNTHSIQGGYDKFKKNNSL